MFMRWNPEDPETISLYCLSCAKNTKQEKILDHYREADLYRERKFKCTECDGPGFRTKCFRCPGPLQPARKHWSGPFVCINGHPYGRDTTCAGCGKWTHRLTPGGGGTIYCGGCESRRGVRRRNPYYPVHGGGHRIGWLETPGRFQADEWLDSINFGPQRETMSESNREFFQIEDAAMPGQGTQPLWRTNPYTKNPNPDMIMYRGARRGDPAILTGPSFFTSAEIFAKTYGPVAPFMLDLQNPKIVDVSGWQDGVGMLEYMSDRHRAEFNQDLEDDGYDSVLANFGDMVVVYLLDLDRATLVE